MSSKWVFTLYGKRTMCASALEYNSDMVKRKDKSATVLSSKSITFHVIICDVLKRCKVLFENNYQFSCGRDIYVKNDQCFISDRGYRNPQIAKFMEPTWGPPGYCGPQMGPMLAPWTLLSGWLWQNQTEWLMISSSETWYSGAAKSYSIVSCSH